jgi:hypothetical protein
MDGQSRSTPTPTLTPSHHETPLRELAAQITELAGQLNAAQYRWLTLIAEFERRQGWADGSLCSCAHWLNYQCGLNLGAAREKVRVAHALKGLPKIAASMQRGELSYSKVRALTRVATALTEDSLLMFALHGTAHHIETLVRHFRHAQEAEELSREASQQASRSVEYWYDGDGSLVFKARLPGLAGAMLVKALESAVTTMSDAAVAEGSFQSRRADALAFVAESFLQQAHGSLSTADRHQVVVHVDAETLKTGTAGRCHIEGGPALPAETVRRLTCDASLVSVIENAQGETLDVGRKTRTIPPAIRRALNARDAGCCFPGCTHRRYVDAHHIEHWVDGGATKLSNLVSLCRQHHRLMHEGGMTVQARPDGGWRFTRADGREYEPPGAAPHRPYEWSELAATHAAAGIEISAETAACRWIGERIDYELGVSMLCGEVDHAQRASAAAARWAATHLSIDGGGVSAEVFFGG